MTSIGLSQRERKIRSLIKDLNTGLRNSVIVLLVLSLVLSACQVSPTPATPDNPDVTVTEVGKTNVSIELEDLNDITVNEAALIDAELLASESAFSTQAVSQYGTKIYNRDSSVAYRRWHGYNFPISSGYEYYAVLTPKQNDIDLYADTYNSSWQRRRLASSDKGGKTVEVIKITKSMLRSGESRAWFSIYGYRASSYNFSFYRKSLTTSIPAKPVLKTGYNSAHGPTFSSPTVKLQWNSAARADKYGVYVRDLTTGQLVYVNNNVQGTSINVTLKAGHRYRWNMASFNSKGYSGYTAAKYFQVKASTTSTTVGTIKGNDYPYPYSNMNYADPWNFYNRQCTSFAAWRIRQKGIPFHNYYGAHWGNANNWDNAARAIGKTVNRTPKAGAIAVWEAGVSGAHSLYGHVAYVAQVHNNGTVTIEDYNWSVVGGYGKRTVPASSISWFIHF